LAHLLDRLDPEVEVAFHLLNFLPEHEPEREEIAVEREEDGRRRQRIARGAEDFPSITDMIRRASSSSMSERPPVHQAD
jgi:hypothetical protein